jgi:hypothetical protein
MRSPPVQSSSRSPGPPIFAAHSLRAADPVFTGHLPRRFEISRAERNREAIIARSDQASSYCNKIILPANARVNMFAYMQRCSASRCLSTGWPIPFRLVRAWVGKSPTRDRAVLSRPKKNDHKGSETARWLVAETFSHCLTVSVVENFFPICTERPVSRFSMMLIPIFGAPEKTPQHATAPKMPPRGRARLLNASCYC